MIELDQLAGLSTLELDLLVRLERESVRHDVIEVASTPEGICLRCDCGESFAAGSKDAATGRQLAHRGIELSRAALRGEDET